jgi:hypothetical protein
MARKATSKTAGRSKATAKGSSKSKAVANRRTGARGRRASDTGEAFIKLLQSPLVADLVAVAATAALAALAEHGFSSRGAGQGRSGKAGKAVKEAGKAAASAIGRRLGTEVDEIRRASKAAKGSAKT